jgi:hypothetical protein
MTDDSILRMAAIAAVISASSSGEDPGMVGRRLGEAWAQDQRRLNMGLSSLMHKRSSSSIWK